METRTVPFFNYPELYRQHQEDFDKIITDVLSRGAYIMQRDLFEFEAQLADYLNVKHAIGVADGTMALLLSCIAAGISEGDEVIVPSHTFVASASSIHHSGGVPVLCDCGPDNLIDADSVKKLLTSRTKAIMPVQLNGRTANMDPILEIAEEHGLKIIEDSCQALGSKFKNRFAGTFGAAGTFSFFPAKTLGAFGDAGAVVTNDSAIAERIVGLRDHGRDHRTNTVTQFGFNARLDNLQAAILMYRLSKYDDYVKYRRGIAEIYQAALQEIEDLVLPPGPHADADHFDVFQNYELRSGRRDELRAHLDQHGVGTILQWGGSCLHQFSALELRAECPNTEILTTEFMMIPMNTVMTFDDARYVSSLIRSFYGLPKDFEA
ncbi:MAG: DegT/DnrJ/EryC1/StrS family aminotransferase [Gammaproteobacteria bacterium]|nr:DegT/DnrJ/EryC1/StrS family aminotransferase [Gammaproteobacteria bacterium]